MPAAAQHLLAGTLSCGDILPPPDGLAAEMPPPPPPGVFALASGRSMQVSAAAQQRAAVLLAADAAPDVEAAGACAHNLCAQSPRAAEAAGRVPPPPPGMFAYASGRSMQVSAAAREHAASLLVGASIDAGFDAASAGSSGGSGGEAGPALPPAGMFAYASGRSMQISAAAHDRAASLLADASDDAGFDAAAAGSPGRSGGEAGAPAPPPAGMPAFASGRYMQVSAAAQERAAMLLADPGDIAGQEAAAAASLGGSGGEAGPAPPPAGMFALASGCSMQVSAAAQERAASLLADASDEPGFDAAAASSQGRYAGQAGPAPPSAGVFALASGRSMQVSAAAQERAATLLADADDAEGPDAAGKRSASGSGGEAGIMPPPPGMFALASGRSMQVSAAAQQRAAAVLAADACSDAAPDTAGAESPGAGAGEGSAQAPPPPVGMFALASGRSMQVSAAAQQRAAALLALCAEEPPARDADAGEESAGAPSLYPDAYPGIEMPSLADDSAMLQMLREVSGGMRSGAGPEQPAAAASPSPNPGNQMPDLGFAVCVPGGSGARPAEPAPVASPSPNPGIEMPSLGDDGAALLLLPGGEARHAAAAAPGSGCGVGPAGADAQAAPLPAAAEALPPLAGPIDDAARASSPCCDAGAPAEHGTGGTSACAKEQVQASDERAAGQTGSAGGLTALCQPVSSSGAPEPPVAHERGCEGLGAAEAGPSQSLPPTVAFADDEAEQAGASSPNPMRAEHAAAHGVAAEAHVPSTVHLDEPAAHPESAERPGQQSAEGGQSHSGAGGPTLDPAEGAVPYCHIPVQDLGAGQWRGPGREVPDLVCSGEPWLATDAAGPAEQGQAAAAAAPPVVPTVPQGDAAAQPADLELHGALAGGVPPTLPFGEAEPGSTDPGLPPTLPLAALPQRDTGPTAADVAQAHADACPAEASACLRAQGAHAGNGPSEADIGASGAPQAPAGACGADDASSLSRSASAPLQCASAARADLAELPGSKRSHSEGRRAGRSSKRARRASSGARGTGSGARASRDPAAAGPAGADALPRPVPARAEAGCGDPATAGPVLAASAAAHAPDRVGEPDPNPEPLHGTGAWATAGGRRIQVDAAKAAAARALLGAGGTRALGGPSQQDAADASPGAMGGAMRGAGVWAKATGKRVHVDPAKLAAAQARLGKRAPLAERGAPEAALTPDPKRRAIEAGAGDAIGVRVRGDVLAQHPDCRAAEASACGALGTDAPSLPAPTRVRPETAGTDPNGAATPAVGADTSTPADKQGGRVSGGGRAARAGSRSGTGSESGSGQGTPAGSSGRRALGSLSRSGSGFKAPRRFVSPMRNPGLARVR